MFKKEEEDLLIELKKNLKNLNLDNYYGSSEYLINWLKQYSFDVKKTEEGLRKTLEWRKENKVCESLNEDFSDLTILFPYHIHGNDFQGRPLVIFELGNWDFRKAVVEQNRESQLFRYMIKFCETLNLTCRKNYENFSLKSPKSDEIEDKNESKEICIGFNGIFDCKNFSIWQLTSPKNVKFICNLASMAETHFPRFPHKVYLINSKPVLKVLLKLIGPFLKKETLDTICLLGSDKNEWKNELDKIMSQEEYPESYGGKKII